MSTASTRSGTAERGVQPDWAPLPETLSVASSQILRVDNDPQPAGGRVAAGKGGGTEVSTETTSACPCTALQDPQVISNPPGQPAISYRADDFTGFRRALLRPLSGEQAIGVWRPAPGDLGLQVLEWWAYLADVLTFYNERYANESYLRTATQQGSIANLVALIGYEPAPGDRGHRDPGRPSAPRATRRAARHPVRHEAVQHGVSRCPGTDL